MKELGPSRIALLRRAGIGLADIEWFLAAPTAAVIDRWRADLAAETMLRRRALDALAFALGFRTSVPKEPAMAVIIRPVDSAAELVTAFDVAGAQFDPAIDHTDQRRFAELHGTSRSCPAQADDILSGTARAWRQHPFGLAVEGDGLGDVVWPDETVTTTARASLLPYATNFCPAAGTELMIWPAGLADAWEMGGHSVMPFSTSTVLACWKVSLRTFGMLTIMASPDTKPVMPADTKRVTVEPVKTLVSPGGFVPMA
jgi:hypothetical protein